MKEEDLIYTDLAIEASEMVHEKKEIEVEGVIVTEKSVSESGTKITTVEIVNENGMKAMGKPMGKYITIESNEIGENDIDKHKEISKILANSLNTLVDLTNVKEDFSILLVGLGNSNVSADSLGPKVINDIIITRHLFLYMPNELDSKVFGNVSAIIPGVMGTTGMETSEIVKGIVDKTNPNLVIVIDSLAARNVARLNKTIQITDTGIHPGSGVGNKRKALDSTLLNTKVIAIGVPTVVNALTLINDLSVKITKNQSNELDRENYKEFTSLCVTPKEEDLIIERLKNIITNGLNIYLHKGLEIEDIKDFMY